VPKSHSAKFFLSRSGSFGTDLEDFAETKIAEVSRLKAEGKRS
jgi:hypothetical protein